MYETIDSVCGSLTAIYPPLGITYQILRASYALANGDLSFDHVSEIGTSALSIDQITDLLPEASRKYGPDALSGMLEAAASVISFGKNLDQVNKAEYEETMKFWAKHFGWATTYTMGGNTYASSFNMTSPEGLLGFTLMEQGGIMAIYDYYHPGDHEDNSERRQALMHMWENDKPVGDAKTIEMTELARDFVLNGGNLDSISPKDLPAFTNALNNALIEMAKKMEDDKINAPEIILGDMGAK